jgi:hypothetical protein
MDWTKAKNILIVALLVTNLVLLGAYVMREAGNDGDDDATLRRILTEYNVFLETELPRQPDSMAVLYVQPETYDSARVERALSEQTPASKTDDDDALLDAANAVLERCGFMTENAAPVTPFEADGGKTLIRYRDIFEGIPIEESYIICTMEDGRVADISRKWYTPLELHDRKGEIIGPIEALMQLLPEKNEDDTVIVRDMELVYRVDPDRPGEESLVGDTALPAWKITDSIGAVIYIAAYAQ